MKEFNSWDEHKQYEYLKENTDKNIILLNMPVFVHNEKSYIVETYDFEKLDDFILKIKNSNKKDLYFYSANHYKEIAMKLNEMLLLSPPQKSQIKLDFI